MRIVELNFIVFIIKSINYKATAILHKSSVDPTETSHTTFLKFVKSSEYVDKTAFIAEAFIGTIWHPHPLLITRPRGFGKTLALSSIYYFCDHTQNATEIFSGLDIMKRNPNLDAFREEYMNTFPVIWIDFQTVKFETYEENLKEIRRIISNVYRRFEYLLKESKNFWPYDRKDFEEFLCGKSNDWSLGRSISRLGQFISYHHIKLPIVLIDNYDVPCKTGYVHNHFKEMEKFMESFYMMTLEDGRRAHKIVLAGVTQIAQKGSPFIPQYDIFDQLVLDAMFPEYFGFSSEEVKNLLKKIRSSVLFATLNDRYGGYTCGNSTMFNPSSVINELFSQKAFHWANIESKDLFGNMIFEPGLYPLLTLQQIMLGERRKAMELAKNVHFPGMKTCELDYWSYLAHAGYVTIKRIGKSSNAWISVPNLEVRKRIESALKEKFNTAPDYKTFTDYLVNGNYSKAIPFFYEYIYRAGDYFKGNYFYSIEEYGTQVRNIFYFNELQGYVMQMLTGVQFRCNASIKYYRNYNNVISYDDRVTYEIKPKKTGKPVQLTMKMDESSKELQNSTFNPLSKTKEEILINVKGNQVNVSVNYY